MSCLAFAAAAALLAAAPPGEAAKRCPQAPGRPTPDDRGTLATLHHHSAVMVRLGALAPARSSSAQIASFGADLVEHHARANRAIGALSRELGVTLVLPPPRDEAEAARRKSIGGRIAVLELLRGDDFDRAFARVTADAHQQALDRSRDTLDETCHPRVRELLAEQVLGLERLLRTAEALSRATRVAPQAERAR